MMNVMLTETARDRITSRMSTVTFRAPAGPPKTTAVASSAVTSIPLLRALAPARLLATLRAAREQPFRRGDVLVNEDSIRDTATFVVSGFVKTVRSQADGRELIVEILGPGEIIEFPGLEGLERSQMAATALSAGEALRLPLPCYRQIFEQEPAFARQVIEEMSARLEETRGRLVEVAGAGVDARLARVWLHLSDRFGLTVTGGRRIPLVLTRQEIADLLGTALETAIRSMSRFAREHLITTEKDGFIVREHDRLQALASGDYERWLVEATA